MNRLHAIWGTLICAGVAHAASVNLAITSGGGNSAVVSPGAVVPYSVTATLSDTNNEGLAAILFDLSFTGGPLTAASEPSVDPMLNFDRPAGLTNPAGFGGTVVSGTLVQVGGAQNTIKNTIANAPVPIGIVIPDVGHSPVVVVDGQLTAPVTPGSYSLVISNVVASVIRAGEDGSGAFWATEAATAGSLGNLTVTVAGTMPFTAAGEGARYIAITPPSGVAPIAFLVTGAAGNPSVSCVSAYVQADGRLAASATFQSPAAWGAIVHVADSELLPLTAYDVQVDTGTPGSPVLSAPVVSTTWKWGDADNNGNANLDDILCVLSGFSGSFVVCSRYAVDLMPEVPDNLVTLDDILGVLNAFSGGTYGGAPPCP